jgi:hypothetical protein
MDRLNYIVTMLERTLGTRTKRHILGGALISMSLMLSGLALTIVTIKIDEEDNEENEIQDY